MKTDQEIKDWIDEREVFCKKELIIFMFNKNNGGEATQQTIYWILGLCVGD